MTEKFWSFVWGFGITAVFWIVFYFVRWARKKTEEIRIERYTFTLGTDAKLGTSSDIDIERKPDVSILGERLVTNVTSPGLVIIERVINKAIGVDGTDLFVGSIDAYVFAAAAMISMSVLSLGIITKEKGIRIVAKYTGLIPPGMSEGAEFKFCFSFMGTECAKTLVSNWERLLRSLRARYWRLYWRLPWNKRAEEEEEEEEDDVEFPPHVEYIYDKPCSVCNAPADDVNGYVPCQTCNVPLCEKCVEWVAPEPHGVCPEHTAGGTRGSKFLNDRASWYPCEVCGVLISCQGSDDAYRYHFENPVHIVALAAPSKK